MDKIRKVTCDKCNGSGCAKCCWKGWYCKWQKVYAVKPYIKRPKRVGIVFSDADISEVLRLINEECWTKKQVAKYFRIAQGTLTKMLKGQKYCRHNRAN